MNIIKLFSDYRHVQVFILSSFSAIPLGILYKAVPAWLSEAQISIAIITTFSIAKLSYSFKFLWSPFIDHIKFPIIGKLGIRKSWMVLCQASIAFILFMISNLDPTTSLSTLYILVIALGFASATYDIVFDAFRIEKFEPELQAIGAATAGLGYRIGLIMIGAGAFYLSDLYSWQATFFAISISYIMAIFYTISLSETKIVRKKFDGLSVDFLKLMTIDPFIDFFKRDGAIIILLSIICFKLGDAMLGVVAMPFYLELGFTKSEIGFVSGIFGVIATITGSFIGAYLMCRIGSLRAMILTAILQSITNLSFVWLNHMGHDLNAFMIAIAIENVAGGMGNGVLAGYLSILCNKKFTATQFALFSSASGLVSHSIVFFGGALVEIMGWDLYFIMTIVLAVPGIFFLTHLKNKLENKK